MRTTITLDDDVFESAKSLAASSGKQLGQVISQLARRGLHAAPRTKRKNGLVVFDLPPNSPIIPSDRARDLLNEELK